MQKNVWRPSKTFIKNLEDLPGSDFSSLYGKITIPGSEYVFFHSFSDSKKRPYPYLVGEDKRNAGEILESIEPSINSRAMEMLDNDMVRHDWNARVDYVGKLQKCYVVIAKELVLPKRFKKEVEKYETACKKEESMSLKDSIVSGNFFVELEQTDLFEKKLAKILEKEGAQLGNRTVVDVSMFAGNLSYPHSIELMERAARILKDYNYKPEEMPWMSFGMYLENPGHAYSDMWQLRNCNNMFIGEVKTIEPLLPCGKTHIQRMKEWNAIWKQFRKEEKQGLHKIPPKKEFDKNGKLISITYETASPNIPCDFIKGHDKCAPSWCETASRGEYVKRKDAKKSSGKLIDLLDDEHKEKLSKVAESVKQFYSAFDELKEKEEKYR
jgi:hypothetical protein